MNEYVGTAEIASLWHVHETLVARYCREKRIPGARKEGKRWLISKDAVKPSAMRRGEGMTIHMPKQAILPLPIGISDYRRAVSEYYYVDKTLMIKDILDENALVSLFTRPLRFGKSLNMDMLRCFFEKSSEDSSVYFVGKNIWSQGQRYTAEQGQYPVIYLSFKDIKSSDWPTALELLKDVIRVEFARHRELEGSEALTTSDARIYRAFVEAQASDIDYMNSLKHLSRMLHMHYQKAPIIIIDEYDTPIQQGYSNAFYDQSIVFMRNFFSNGLKDNPHLSYGFLTGILRVAKESIFSGLNNMKVYSILDTKFSQYFGFTQGEVNALASYYGAREKLAELATWYDGYLFGNTEIYNPWSVINYFGNECRAMPYWVSTSDNSLIGSVLQHADKEIFANLYSLLQGRTVAAQIDNSVIYPELNRRIASVYSFLLITGYLKATNIQLTPQGSFFCQLALPNREVISVYYKEILERFADIISPNMADFMQNALFEGDATALQKYLRQFLLETVSFYDTMGENFYHGLLLGLCAMMSSGYRMLSNRESGFGRFEIQLIPNISSLPGIIIEIKAAKKAGHEELATLASQALEQIVAKEYAADLAAKGIRNILYYGVAFSGKCVEVAARER